MSRVEEIKQQIEELEKKRQELQKELEFEQNIAEITYPFEVNEIFWALYSTGEIGMHYWDNTILNQSLYKPGNVFKNQEEAKREFDRRELLTRFRKFRDRCNGDWKPDWNDSKINKYFITYYTVDNDVYIFIYHETEYNHFPHFGYFKNEEDCKRALELFGDEIKRLYVEEER